MTRIEWLAVELIAGAAACLAAWHDAPIPLIAALVGTMATSATAAIFAE